MKFNIPKITQPIPLTDYAPEMVHDDGTAAIVWAWVNPPSQLLNTYEAMRARAQAAIKKLKDGEKDEAAMQTIAKEISDVGLSIYELFAQLWSARSDPATHWTAEEVKELANNPENPALYSWLTDRTLALIRDYRAGIRKN